MRLPMTARYRIPMVSVLAMASVLLAGCAGDPTAPRAIQGASELRTSPFVPTAAQKALVGVSDGTYTFTFDPSQAQALSLGASHLDLPANAVCDLETSSYGSAFWNDSCTPETELVTITAVVSNAATDHPSVEFQPALRFNPDSRVNLYLFVTDKATLDNSRVMKYCSATGCVDESTNDSSLQSYVDTQNQVVFRRIKHFSGYVISQLAEEVENLLGW